MKKIVLEEVKVDSYEYTGIVFGSDLPGQLQKFFNVDDETVIRVTGDYRVELGAGTAYIDLVDAVAYLGDKQTKVDLLAYLDKEAASDVILSKGDVAEWFEDYKENQILRRSFT